MHSFLPLILCSLLSSQVVNAQTATAQVSVTARKDDAPAAVQAAMPSVAVLGSSSVGGGLIQATSG